MHRRFGDAVHVDELRMPFAIAFKPRAQVVQLERLATEDDVAQGIITALLREIGLQQLAER